jgi:hydroxylamine reductase
MKCGRISNSDLNVEVKCNMTVTKNITIGELLEVAPEKADILLEAGMHCLGCPASRGETLEEACAVHGIDVEELLARLNA